MGKEKDFLLWDNDKSEETLIFRKLMWGDVKAVVNEYGKSRLKKIFLKYYFKFDKRNQNFWRMILGIEENEINKRAKRKFERNS